MILEMQTRCYEDRLKLRGDQIEVFKIMHEPLVSWSEVRLDKNMFFRL